MDGWFKSIEITKMLILFSVGLPRSQCLGKHGEPGTKEAGHLKVAQAIKIMLWYLDHNRVITYRWEGPDCSRGTVS